MNEMLDVSVVISTYNRCEKLTHALRSMFEQETRAVRYEVIVVDNNSTDRTRQAVESFMSRGGPHIRYIFEPRQGVAYGRNAGIQNAKAPIIAFTDDDVCVASDWVKTIKRTLDEHPEVDCVGGKVLPRWEHEWPSWLTPDHWSPLALLDYGDEPMCVNSDMQRCLITANVAYRREVFERIGPFSPHVQVVKRLVGTEDQEILLRLWRAGGQGLYAPNLVATTEVTADRMTKAYHRRWHTGHGRCYAIMRVDRVEQSIRGHLFDVPLHLYRRVASDALAWFTEWIQGHHETAFLFETRLRFAAGFFKERLVQYFLSKVDSFRRDPL